MVNISSLLPWAKNILKSGVKVINPMAKNLSFGQKAMRAGGITTALGAGAYQFQRNTMNALAKPSTVAPDAAIGGAIQSRPIDWNSGVVGTLVRGGTTGFGGYAGRAPNNIFGTNIPIYKGPAKAAPAPKNTHQGGSWTGKTGGTGPAGGTGVNNIFGTDLGTPLAGGTATGGGLSPYKINKALGNIKANQAGAEALTKYQTLEKPYVGLE